MKVDVLAWIANTPADNGHKAAEREKVRAAIAELIEAAEIMERCAYAVSRDINPRGYEWCISYLDEALPILRAALAKVTP